MTEDEVERLEAQLRLIRAMVEDLGGARIVPVAVSQEEAAQMLSCSARHISRMVRGGLLRPREVGGLRRIPVSQIHALLEEPDRAGEPPAPKRGFDAAEFSAKLKRLRKKP